MKFYKKIFVAVVCILVAAFYPVVGKDPDMQDWLARLSETARSIMEDPKQLAPGLRDVVGALSETLFHTDSPKGKKSKASHEQEPPAEKYKPGEAPSKAAAPVDNLFNLLQEIQQTYTDFNEGKKVNYRQITKLVFRLLDFIVTNPDMDTFLIEMASKFEYGPVTKPMIRSTLGSAIAGYRGIRKMSGMGEMVEVITQYIPLETFADNSYLNTMINGYATMLLGHDVYRNYKPLVEAIIELISISAGHLRDLSKDKSQFHVNKFNEYVMLIPLKQASAAFETYSQALKSLNEMGKEIASTEVVKSVSAAREQVDNLIAKLEKADEASKIEYSQFDSSFSQEVSAAFTKLKAVANDLTVVANKVQNRQLKEFAQKIQDEVKRWKLMKEIHAKSKNIKSVDDWKSLINKMVEFSSGVTKFQTVSKAVLTVYQEINKILLSSGFNWNALKTEL